MTADKTPIGIGQILCTLLILLGGMEVALAHGAERGLVMLLPTGYYKTGGGLAVAASFLVLAVAPIRWLRRYESQWLRLFRFPHISPFWPSVLSFTLLCVLLYAGYFGDTDPLANPLPLFIWVLWWVGLIIVHCISGNLWAHINPWSGPVLFTRKLLRLSTAPFPLPHMPGYAVAIFVFFGFAWLELVYPAPDDPSRLATFVLTYWGFVFVCMLLFGEKNWFERAEPFAIFFRLIGACSPFCRRADDSTKTHVGLTWPGARFLNMPALPISGVLFVLLTLSTVSFDGFSKTFTWLSLIGVNPLEYPGRSAVIVSNTWGLVTAFGVLGGLFFSSVFIGCLLSNRMNLFVPACGRLIYSIIPISLVFHIAHYLTLILVNGQYAVLAINDPMGRGWNLLGLGHAHVTTSFLTSIHSVTVIWIAQTVIIVLGHIMGMVIAHGLGTQLFESAANATRSQIPLAILMIAYTVFGLWLLSTASIG